MPLTKTQGFWPVVLAIAGNVFVAFIKFAVAIASGSSVLFSEAVHSAADTLNELFLLVGLQKSLKKADDRFEYGYGNERFFWALISACGIFFAGAGVTAWSGISTLLDPKPLAFSQAMFLVLVVSFVVEFSTLLVALRHLRIQFPELSWRERVGHADSATLAVLLEDSVAVLGVFVAAISITLSYYTGNRMWDGAGSLFIAALLAGVAVTLIIKNRPHLLGLAMPDELRENIITLIEADPAIEKVIDFKSSMVALGSYRIKCEVEFNGPSLLREAYRDRGMREQYEEVQHDFEEFKKFLSEYADRIPRLMGKRIDTIEVRIRERFPSVRNIDIEIN